MNGLMIQACIGYLLGWQYTTAQVFKSSADVGYFLNVFSKSTRSGTPVVGMIILVIMQTLLSWLSILFSQDVHLLRRGRWCTLYEKIRDYIRTL